MEEGVHFIALGGLGHIGLNAMVMDTGESAYLLDCGIEFPDPNEPGVDQIIPDVNWLRSLGSRLKAIILTHGHEDHIGGVMHVLKHRRVPVYGPRLAIALLNERLEEHAIHGELQLKVVDSETTLSLDGISIEFLRVTHSIPDCFSLAIRTTEGVVVHTGDWKLDEEPVDGQHIQVERFRELGDRGVSLLLGDSTNAEVHGRTRSEREVGRGLETLIREHDGRVVVALFSSNLHRLHLLAEIAESTDRHMVLLGRGLEKMARVGRRVGLNRTDPSLFIQPQNIGHIPPQKLLICCTGTQGEPFSALYRASQGKHHQLHIQKGDLVLHSARKIPGNEGKIYEMFDGLTRLGAKVVHGRAAPIHASGHATREELVRMIEWLRPQAFVPVHGETSFLHAHAALAESVGVPHVRVIENGVWFSLRDGRVERGRVESFERLYFDGYSTGDATSMGVKQRWRLAHAGAIAVQVGRRKSSGAWDINIEMQCGGIPDPNGTFMEGCKEFLKIELSKLPLFTPKSDFEDAAKMLTRRFTKTHTGKKPMVMLVLRED